MSFWAYRTLRGVSRYPGVRDLSRVQVLRYETRADRELACASGAGIYVLASSTARGLLLAAYRSRVIAGDVPGVTRRDVPYASNEELWRSYVAHPPYL
mgnify:CR=1 FL=1|jgi:hypothetical protein